MGNHDVFYLLTPLVDITVPLMRPMPVMPNISTPIDPVAFEPGGMANLAIEATRLGLDMVNCGYLGNDFMGRYLMEQYAEQGIDTSLVKMVDGITTTSVICLVDNEKQHTFCSMLNSYIPMPADPEAEMRGCKALCLTGYHLAEEGTAEGSLTYMRAASGLGMDVFFDPGPLVGSIPRETLDEALGYCTWIVANEEEALAITGIAEIEKAAVALRSRSGSDIVIKAGARGCYHLPKDGESGRWYEGFTCKAVDTTACGDSFLAALLVGATHGMDNDSMFVLANAVGAAKCIKRGSGTQVPTKDEVIDMLSARYTLTDEQRNGPVYELVL